MSILSQRVRFRNVMFAIFLVFLIWIAFLIWPQNASAEGTVKSSLKPPVVRLSKSREPDRWSEKKIMLRQATTTTTTAPKPEKNHRAYVGQAPSSMALPQIVPNPDHNALMAAAGIDPSDFQYVEIIVAHEDATWCPTRSYGMPASECPAVPIDTSHAYGIPQSFPGTKMASAGADWQTNPVTQLIWLKGYVQKFGGFEAAARYRVAHNSY